jgi:hypothetical protein
MTPDQKKDLLIAILSMDSYNQGYEPGLSHGSLTIGSATLVTDSTFKLGLNATFPVGFYAAAYDTPYGTVISYRGTDGNVNSGSDIAFGWPIALGYTLDNQAAPALNFYNSVAGHESAILTGHSLGGGLAGYVAALNGNTAVLFDHMPFGIASVISKIVREGVPANLDDLNASYQALKDALNFSNVKGEFVDNEILESVRKGDAQALIGGVLAGLSLLVPAVGTYLAGFFSWLGLGLAATTELLESQVAKTPIESHSGVTESLVNPFDLLDRASRLHMIDYLVNLKFAGYEEHTKWHSIGPEFFSSYFNDQIAKSVGFKEGNADATAGAEGKMGRAIAYSTLEKGGAGLVFGDSAARAMFDDLDDLGSVYVQQNINSLLTGDIDDTAIFDLQLDTTMKQAFADIAVQYAAALAAHKIKVALAKDKVEGLDIEQGVFGSGLDRSTLALDLSSVLWEDVFRLAGVDTPDNPSVDPKIVYRPAHSEYIRPLHLAQFEEFLKGAFGFRTLDDAKVGEFVQAIWNGPNYKAIDRFHFGVPKPVEGQLYEVVMSDRSYKVKDGHGDKVHIDAYHGVEFDDLVYSTLGNDMVFTGEGNDLVVLRGGRDYVQGGTGNDTVVDRINPNLEHSPRPDDVPENAPFDDIFVALTKDEDVTPWQMLLQAYGSDFEQADEYKYSVAKTSERLQAANGKEEGGNATKLTELKDPKYDRKGVHLRDLNLFDGLQQVAQLEGFEQLDRDKIEVTLENLNNNIIEKDLLVGVEQITLTEGADTVSLSGDDMRQFPLLIDLGMFAPQVDVGRSDYDTLNLDRLGEPLVMIDGVMKPYFELSRVGFFSSPLGWWNGELKPTDPFDAAKFAQDIKGVIREDIAIRHIDQLLTKAQAKDEVPGEDAPMAFSGYERIRLTDNNDTYIETDDRDRAGVFGEIKAGKGDDIVVVKDARLILKGEKVYTSDPKSAVANQTLALEIDGGDGNDRLYVASGTGAIIEGGAGRDWIFNKSKDGIIYGDRKNGPDADGNPIIDSKENADNIWWWPDVTVKSPGGYDQLKFYGAGLTGGGEGAPTVVTGVAGFLGYAINEMAADGARVGTGGHPLEGRLFTDNFLVNFNYIFQEDKFGNLNMYVANAYQGLMDIFATGQVAQNIKNLKGVMKVENYVPVASPWGSSIKGQDGVIQKGIADVAAGAFGMKFLMANGFLAALALLPPILGMSGAMIGYIHKTLALSDAGTYFKKFAGWVDEDDPLIIDLDGDGIETSQIGAGIRFDHDANLFAEDTGWLSGDDGFLVLDANGNGRIDDGREFFGGAGQTGAEELAGYDSNGDGKINAADVIWNDLRVWQIRMKTRSRMLVNCCRSLILGSRSLISRSRMWVSAHRKEPRCSTRGRSPGPRVGPMVVVGCSMMRCSRRRMSIRSIPARRAGRSG